MTQEDAHKIEKDLDSSIMDGEGASQSPPDSEALFRSVAQSASDAIIIIDSCGRILFWNAAAEALFGYPSNQVMGKSLALIIPERFRQAHESGMRRLAATGEPHILGRTVEMVGVRQEGTEVPVELSLSSWATRQGTFYTGILRDVTERKEAAEEIASLARFPSENPSPVLRVSQEGRILYANAASESLLSMWNSAVDKPLPAEIYQQIADVLEQGTGRRIDLPCRGRIYSLDLVPVRDSGYVNLYGRDITERTQAQDLLRENNQFITHVIESLNHPFYVVDAADYSIKMANSATYLGDLSPSMTCHLLIHGNEKPCDMYGQRCPLAEIRRTKQPAMVEHMHRDRDGNRRTYEVRAHPILDDEGNVTEIIEYTLDITDRKEAEEALQQARAELEQRVEERTAELAAIAQELERVAFQNAELYEAESHARKLAETLSAASLALTQTLDLDAIIETLLDFLGQVVPFDGANVMLPKDETSFVVRAARGLEPAGRNQGILGTTILVAENPQIGQILRTRKSFLIDDTREYPGWAGCPGVGQVLSWLGLPLVAGERIIGICGFHKAERGFYSPGHVAAAEALAAQAAVAVQNAWLFEQVRSGRERLRALSRQLVEIQETERRYIARELHDEAGQCLTSLKVGLRLLERDAHRREAVVAGVEELMGMVDGVIDNLHRLSMHLRPATLDHLGLVAALRQYAEAISDQHGLTLEFETVGITERLPPDMEAAIHRIVQEALTNIVRHAKASRVDILLKQRGGNFIVLVEDNGVGFDPANLDQSGRLGIFGMRERTEMLGGRLIVESAPGAGTTLLLEIPYVPSDSDRG